MVVESRRGLTACQIERLIEILQEFPPEEVTRKRYINEMVSWSAKFGDIETGDPEFHHAIGSIYADGANHSSSASRILTTNMVLTTVL